MILPDVNVLIRAHRPDLPGAAGVTEWLESALGGDERLAVWDAILESAYRILTFPKFTREPEAAPRAMAFLNEVRDSSATVFAGSQHWAIFEDLVRSSRATGNLVTDAGIAAVAIENGCRLATFDRDFALFPSLNWFEPPI